MGDRAIESNTTRREQALAWVLPMVAMPLLSLLVAGPRLFTRPFWSDEVFTWLIASDPNLGHANAALAAGVDTNAPFIHWFYRLVGDAFGHTPLAYRSAGSIFLSLAVIGLYFTLRQTLRVGPAIVGCLAFCSLPIVVAHQTETRFYGPLVAAAVWTCYFVGRRRERTSIATAAGLAIASIALCGTHYFGVIALTGVVAVEAMRAPRRSLATLLPTLAGFATTFCLLPLIRTQRAAVADVGGTWVPDAFVTNLRVCLQAILPLAPLLAFVAIGVVGLALAGRRRVVNSLADAGRSPLVGLGLFVVAMLAFDRLLQPALVPRYLFPALPAFALVVASLAAALPRRAIIVAGVGFGAIVCGELNRIRGELAQPRAGTALAIVASADRLPGDVPIVSDWRGHLLAIYAARPEMRERLRFVDDPAATCEDLRQAAPFERKLVPVLEAYYGFAPTVPVADLDRLQRFVLITEFPETVDARFKVWNRRQIDPLTFEISRGDLAKAQ